MSNESCARITMKRVLSLLCVLTFVSFFFPGAEAAEQLNGMYTTDAVLYIPDFQSAEFRELVLPDVEVSTRAPLEKTLLTLLLEEISDTVPDAFSGLRDLSLLYPGYVQSRDTALIHLSHEVLDLDPLSRFTLCQAITNTICAPGQIKSCLIMADGKALSLDEAQTIPTGVFAPNEYSDPLSAMSQLLFRHTESETTNLHCRANTALFYPVSAGHGVVCEVKSLAYTSDAIGDAVKTILAALSESELFDVPKLPELNDYLVGDPELKKVEDTENVLVLSFNSELSDVLSEYGILRSVLMAGITMSLQGYFPWMNGVRCEMDGEAILAIVPVGLYDGANEVVSFDRGFMHWQDFSHFILTEIALYYGNDLGRLSETRRYIPSSWANEPQQLLTQLFNGPSYYDSVTDLRPLFTGAETLEETLKRVETKENQLNLDFNAFFWDGKTDLNKEQNAVFAIVNTLTKLQWCRRVKLTVNGEAPQGLLAYETPFMRSMDYER